jgi:hypothetical protein
MKLDPLAEMHLLLREHGWEPESENFFLEDVGPITGWRWTLAGTDHRIFTSRDANGSYCCEDYAFGSKGHALGLVRDFHTPAALRRRLKQLRRNHLLHPALTVDRNDPPIGSDQHRSPRAVMPSGFSPGSEKRKLAPSRTVTSLSGSAGSKPEAF